MGIKSNIGIIVGSLVLFCNTASAGQIYNVDPTQSYVKTYVPSWVASTSFGSFTQAPSGELVFTPGWALQWNLTAFSLSGSFDGSVESSPWVPGVAHFGITQQEYRAGAPISAAINLPSSLTFYQSSGDIAYDSGPCATDPFYPPPGPDWYCSGWSTGFAPQLSGTFDGDTLNIQGDSGGFPLLNISFYIGDTPPPLDPDSFTSQYFTYQIVATSVPEPSTLPLILLGFAALYKVNRRKLPD